MSHDHDLIDQIYQVAIHPEILPEVLRALDAEFNSDFCHFFSMNGEHPGDLHVISQNTIDDKTFRSYYEHYHRIDPRKRYINTLNPNSILQCTQRFDPHYVSRSEFYQDFLIPAGSRYIAGACLHAHDDIRVYVAFNHSEDRGEFTRTEMERMNQLLPHLGRATRLMLQNRHFSRALNAGEMALTALNKGVIALDSQNRIIYANRLAEEIIISDFGDIFEGRRINENGCLASPLKAMRQMRTAQSLRRHGATPEKTALVTILPAGGESRSGQPAAGQLLAGRGIDALILITPEHRQRHAGATQLAALFGLSRAEARLAQALAAGQSPDEYARAASVSINTVRTQIRALLAKTGERRLPDLIRMLALLPGFCSAG